MQQAKTGEGGEGAATETQSATARTSTGGHTFSSARSLENTCCENDCASDGALRHGFMSLLKP